MEPARGHRTGSVLIVVVLLGLIVAAGAIVLAVSGQSSSTRAVLSQALLGRTAVELAESGIAEGLSEFQVQLQDDFPAGDARPLLRARAQNGVVPGSALIGRPTLEIEPERTQELILSERLPVKISAVTVTPLRYDLARNCGEVEFACGTTYQVAQGREVYRHVVETHAFSLDADTHHFHVEETELQSRVDRSSDP